MNKISGILAAIAWLLNLGEAVIAAQNAARTITCSSTSVAALCHAIVTFCKDRHSFVLRLILAASDSMPDISCSVDTSVFGYANKASQCSVAIACLRPVLQAASGDTSPIPWNFAKFLVKKDGTVFGR